MRSLTTAGNQSFFTNSFFKKLHQAKSLILLITLGLMALSTYAQVPNPPTGFTAGTATSSSLQFIWIAPAAGPGPTEYYIVRHTSSTMTALTTPAPTLGAVLAAGTVVGIVTDPTVTFTNNTGLSASTQYFYEIWSFRSGTPAFSATPLAGTMTTTAVGTITPSGALSALSTTYGTPSSATTFNVSGTGLGNLGTLLITPPSGFEVAKADLVYGSTITYTALADGTLASQTVNVRLAAATVPATYSGNIVLSNANSSNATVATASSTVNTKALTMSGLSVPGSKVYDGSTRSALNGQGISGCLSSC